MLGFLTPVGRNEKLLVDATAADRFWQSLPRSDAVGAAKQLVDALSDLGADGSLTVDALRALLLLDQRAHCLFEALLPLPWDDFRDGRDSLLERRHLHAAFDLAQTFAQTYVQSLRQVRSGASRWREYAPRAVIGLLRNSQIDLLLRPFVTGQHAGFSWTVLHDAYRLVEGLRAVETPVHGGDEHRLGARLEHEYIHTLLLDWINSGQFSPLEAFWINDRVARWSAALTLVPGPDSALVPLGEDAFAVDLDGDEGLRRMSPRPTGTLRLLDPAPLLALIDREIASLRDGSAGARGPEALGRSRRLKVLLKLALLCAPKPPRITRRGERRAVAMPVQAVRGFMPIARALRHGLRQESPAGDAGMPQVEEITITVYGGYTEGPNAPEGGDGNARALRSRGDAAPTHDVWQLKDRSESGCRLQGQVADCRTVVPGSLIAIRANESAPWSLVMVRRLKRLVGTHVDLGVEYVGQDPRLVALEVADAAGSVAAGPGQPHRFAALYLPECQTQPQMPIKTLLVPAREVRGDAKLVLRTANAVYTIRLKAPLDEQGEFVWVPFEIVGQQGLEQAA